MSPRTLVTGANGFVGRAVVDRLRAEGVSVRAATRSWVDRPSGDAGSVLAPPLDAGSDWQTAVEGIDVVVHCAARVHQRRDRETDPLAAHRRVNRDGTASLARQAAAAGARRFVFVSSIKVNGESTLPGRPFRAGDPPMPQDPYSTSKLEAETLLRVVEAETAMAVTVVRPPLVYGPGVKANFDTMLHWLQHGMPLPFGAIRNSRSLVALDNLVDLIALCCHHPSAGGATLLVSDGEDLSTTDLLRRAAHALGVRSRLFPFPVGWLNRAAKVAGRPELARQLVGSLQVDISETRRLLGWKPPVSVDQALVRTAQHFLTSRR